MTDIKILVCCHRDDIRAGEPPYLPIHVGKALSPLELGITSADPHPLRHALADTPCNPSPLAYALRRLHAPFALTAIDTWSHCRHLHSPQRKPATNPTSLQP